jgi:hypothetical protein
MIAAKIGLPLKATMAAAECAGDLLFEMACQSLDLRVAGLTKVLEVVAAIRDPATPELALVEKAVTWTVAREKLG